MGVEPFFFGVPLIWRWWHTSVGVHKSLFEYKLPFNILKISMLFYFYATGDQSFLGIFLFFLWRVGGNGSYHGEGLPNAL